jgi:beta-lactamase class C
MFGMDLARRPASKLQVFALLLLLVSGSLPAGALDGSALHRAFDARFLARMAEEKVPGAAAAIVHRGQLAGLSMWGQRGANGSLPIDSATIFRIASVSKGFSGVLAALLAHEGSIVLDERVDRYAPQYRLVAGPRALTVEDILGQRSGFVRNAYDNLNEAGLEREEILPRFASLQPLCPPGRCYSYQNNVFSLIEDVIDSTTGKDYATVLRQRLLEPLGMSGTSIGYEGFRASVNRAEPHLKTRTGWRQVRPRTTYYQVASAAGINSGLLDMSQWAIAMLGHRPDVLPPAVIDEALRPRIQTRNELSNRHWRGELSDAHYGLGWRIYSLPDHEIAIHGGWVAGFRAEISISRELDLGLVILSNAETRLVGELSRSFWDLALD